MAQISSITLPNNSKYDIKGSIHTVIGTQTAATGTWTGKLETIDALYDGLTIAYWLPYNGSGNATLNLTLKGGTTTGAINCYYRGNSRLTTHYAAGDMIILTYWGAGKVKVSGTATTDARWVAAQNYTDGNTIPTIYCSTGATTAAKGTGGYSTEGWASGTVKDQTKPCYLIVDMYYSNTAASALTFTASNWPAKPIWINGTVSSASNYTLPKGMYIVYYDGSVFHFRTDGLLPLNPNQVNRGLSIVNNQIGHSNSVTAGTAGTSSATSGSTLAVPYVTYDAQGHITATGTHTHTVTGFLTSSSSLDASKLTGTVPTSALPSYVDDVLEYNAKANFPATGEEGKIYVDKTTNLTWRWGGSAYVQISPSLALGTTASTAAKGNHTHSFTPAGTIAVQTAGTTNNTLKPVTAKTVVTGATFNTVVTGGTTTDVPNISKKTVVTGVTPATVVTSVTKKTVVTGTSVANEVLSFTTGDSISSTTGASATVSTGDSVTVGTAIKAYTGLTTGAAGSATTGDSVTLGNAVTVKTGDAAYKFTGTAGTTGTPA